MQSSLSSVISFLSDLWAAASFETGTAIGASGVLLAGALALGLLAVPPALARPSMRALAGFPLLVLFGGALGVGVYLLGGTARHGLAVMEVGAAVLTAVAAFQGHFRELLRPRGLAVLGGLLLLGFLLAFFGWGEVQDGTIRAMSGAWGDGPLHTLLAEAFVRRPGQDLSMPAFAGEQLREPFGYDFVAAMLRAGGFTVGGASILPAAALLACLLGWSGHLAARFVTRERPLLPLHREQGSSARFAAVLAGVLTLTFGGLQWLVMASQSAAWAPARFFGIHEPAWAKVEELGLIWANHLNTFTSQKHLLLAAAFLLVLVAMLLMVVRDVDHARVGPARSGSRTPDRWVAGDAPEGPTTRTDAEGPLPGGPAGGGAASDARGIGADRRQWEDPVRQDPRPSRLVVFSIATGLLPLFHTHAFLAAGLLWGMAALLQRSLRVVGLGLMALLVASPALLWQFGLVSRSGFLSFVPGWMASGGLLGWVWFWVLNLGAFLPLAGIALGRAVRDRRKERLLLGVPAVLLFLLANVVQFQPYRWDNFKLFLLAWLLLLPLVVAEMLAWRFRGARALVVLLAVLSSLVTFSEMPTHLHFRATYPVYRPQDRAAARVLDRTLPLDAVVLAETDTVHHHPLTLTGRTLFAGYGGWLWTRGFAWEERAATIKELRTSPAAEFCARAAALGITHFVDEFSTVRRLPDGC